MDSAVVKTPAEQRSVDPVWTKIREAAQQAAAAEGKAPQAYCDELAASWTAFAGRLGLANNDFVRTTQPRHKAVVQAIWSTDLRPFPNIFPTTPVQLGPLPVSQGYLYSTASVAVLLLIFSLFFKFTRAGIAMRATAFSQPVALSMGISVRRIFALSWSIAAVVSAIGGILLGAVRGGVDGSLAVFGLKVVPVVILGGLDSVLGAIVGGLVIGVLENLSGGYLDPVFGGGVKEVAPFVALVLILMVKPYGLFGKVKIERV